MRSELTQLLVDMSNLNTAINYVDLSRMGDFLSKLEHYEQIKGLGVAGKIYSLVARAKDIKPSLVDRAKSRRPKELEEVIEEMKQYASTISTEVRKIADTLSPNEGERTTLIDILRKVGRSPDALKKDLEIFREEGVSPTDEELWRFIYSLHMQRLSPIFTELVNLATWLYSEPEYRSAKDALELTEKEYYSWEYGGKISGTTKIAKAIVFSNNINVLAAKARPVYRIKDEDLEEPKIEKPIGIEFATTMDKLSPEKAQLIPKIIYDIYKIHVDFLSRIKNKSPLPEFQETLTVLKNIFSAGEFKDLLVETSDLLESLPRYDINIPSSFSDEEKRVMEKLRERRKEEFIGLADILANQINTTMKTHIEERIRAEQLGSTLQMR